ncbi:hypothetical protein DRK89_13075 [Salmonella enterica subsp. enterica]|nr:hypothetical protein [Salmonella enterica subsp. enterica serovar London]
MLFPEKAGGYRKYTGKHRAARTGFYSLLLWPAFNHIRRGGSCYSPTVRNAIIWISPTVTRTKSEQRTLPGSLAATPYNR